MRTKEGDALPRLEDVLTLFNGKDMELQIEIKSSGNFANLGQVLNGHINTSQVTVISFNHNWLHQFKTLNPNIKTTCLLFGLPMNPVEIVRSAKADGLSVSVGWIDKELVQKCHQAGLKVTAWNANDPKT